MPRSKHACPKMHSVRRHELGEKIANNLSQENGMHSVRRHELGAMQLRLKH